MFCVLCFVNKFSLVTALHPSSLALCWWPSSPSPSPGEVPGLLTVSAYPPPSLSPGCLLPPPPDPVLLAHPSLSHHLNGGVAGETGIAHDPKDHLLQLHVGQALADGPVLHSVVL